MVGIELVRNRERKNRPSMRPTTSSGWPARGVVADCRGNLRQRRQFLTPLIISDDELDEGLDVMTACFEVARSRTH